MSVRTASGNGSSGAGSAGMRCVRVANGTGWSSGESWCFTACCRRQLYSPLEVQIAGLTLVRWDKVVNRRPHSGHGQAMLREICLAVRCCCRSSRPEKQGFSHSTQWHR